MKLSPSSERDLSLTYNGWVIFSATNETHSNTEKDAFDVISGFEEIIEIYVNHHLKKFNLVAIPSKKQESVFKTQNTETEESKPLKLKYGLIKVCEIK